jgi:hypothetical protein
MTAWERGEEVHTSYFIIHSSLMNGDDEMNKEHEQGKLSGEVGSFASLSVFLYENSALIPALNGYCRL